MQVTASSALRRSFRIVEGQWFEFGVEQAARYLNRPMETPSVALNPIVCGRSIFVRDTAVPGKLFISISECCPGLTAKTIHHIAQTAKQVTPDA